MYTNIWHLSILLKREYFMLYLYRKSIALLAANFLVKKIKLQENINKMNIRLLNSGCTKNCVQLVFLLIPFADIYSYKYFTVGEFVETQI